MRGRESLAMREIDGVYAAYFSGEFGNSLGILSLSDGRLSGADVGGVLFDGHLRYVEEDNSLVGEVILFIPLGGTLVTGYATETPSEMRTSVSLGVPLEKVSFHSIQTESGQVNVRFRKVRS